MTLPRLYSEAESAEYLGVTELTLYRWRKRGLIACIMVGKSPRYTEQHVLDYLAAREVSVARTAEPTPSQRGPKRNIAEANHLLLAHQILKARREGR
jgi:excisionase family DNA binding protein